MKKCLQNVPRPFQAGTLAVFYYTFVTRGAELLYFVFSKGFENFETKELLDAVSPSTNVGALLVTPKTSHLQPNPIAKTLTDAKTFPENIFRYFGSLKM